jgi:hypothetical protein
MRQPEKHGEPTWIGFDNAVRETIAVFRTGPKSNADLVFTKIRGAYFNIMRPEFSIDLVAACLRQRIYTNRIINECPGLGSDEELTTAVTRYHKFLRLMNSVDLGRKKRGPFVPTLDIDLCWHTHQLSPQAYRFWCLENLGRAINHDDTIEETTATRGLRATSLAWLDLFDEAYTANDLRKAYFTPARKCAGIIFPPYGVFMLNFGRKLDRAGN